MPFFYGSIDGKKVVELTSLWKELLNGKQGDRALGSTKRHLGLPEIPTLAFPDQPGHGKDKPMPCADGLLLKKLVSGLDTLVLEAKQGVVKNVLKTLGHPEEGEIVSRFVDIQLSEDNKMLVSFVKHEEYPRFVLFTVLKMFAPKSSPSNVFYNCGVCEYLIKCGVKMPEGLARSETQLSDLANPCKWSLENDEVSDYEKTLGSKSHGLVWGTSSYDNGERALHGDLPIFVLTMLKLQTKEARQFKAQGFHTGVVMMGGNDKVALSISEHWRGASKGAAGPLTELLQFLGAAVDHEVAPATCPVALNSDEFSDRVLALVATGHKVYESINSTGTSKAHQQFLTSHGMNAAEHTLAYHTQIPLQLRDFLAEKIPECDHDLISRFLPSFSSEVKRQRLVAYEEYGVAFFFYWKLGESRLAYTEMDRDLMTSVWLLPQSQTQLERLRVLPRSLKPNRQSGASHVARSGPYSRPLVGASANVTQGSVARFFTPKSE